MRVGKILLYCYPYVLIVSSKRLGGRALAFCEDSILFEGFIQDVPFDLKFRKILSIIPSNCSKGSCLKIYVE